MKLFYGNKFPNISINLSFRLAVIQCKNLQKYLSSTTIKLRLVQKLAIKIAPLMQFSFCINAIIKIRSNIF